MAPLVEYSDSEDEQQQQQPSPPPARKKRRVSSTTELLPPLPPSFLDQYSSTVRTSTQDDPSLHAGRKRVTPHVEGNWPTHVYVEWYPNTSEARLLSELVAAAQGRGRDNIQSTGKAKDYEDQAVHSLLENNLGVPQPLHISLSRPLVLKTTEKDVFLARLQQRVNEANIKTFSIQPKDLAWHPNESGNRHFLVLRLQTSPGSELHRLLEICNSVARAFEQPLLYVERKGQKQVAENDRFHISIAWSLQALVKKTSHEATTFDVDALSDESGIPYRLWGGLTALTIHFSELKVRIGQDVHAIPLRARRQSKPAVEV